MSQREVSQLVVQLLDRASAPARRISESVNRINQAVRESRRVPVTGIDRISAALHRNNRALAAARGHMFDAVAVGFTLQRAISGPVRAAADLEAALTDVTKVTDFSPEGLAEFEAAITALSTQVPMAQSELMALAAGAAEAGIAADELVPFVEMAARVGTAFNITGDQAGEALGRLQYALGIGIDETSLLADAMNHLSNNVAASGADILDMMSRVGVQGLQFGFAAEETAAITAAMRAAGAETNVAATSFRNMGRALTLGASASERQSGALQSIGLEATEVAERMQEDAVGTLMDVLARIGEVPEAARAALVSDLFGQEARALAPLIENTQLLADAVGLVRDEGDYAGSAMGEFERVLGTFNSQSQIFRNRLQNLGIAVGEALIPELVELMDRLVPVIENITTWVSQNPELTATIFKVVAGLAALKLAVAGITFAGLIGRGGALWAMSAGLAAIGANAARANASIGRLLATVALAKAPLALPAALALWPSRLGDGTMTPEVEALIGSAEAARGSIMDMFASGFDELTPEQNEALALIQGLRASGGTLPTDDLRRELALGVVQLGTEIHQVQRQLDQLGEGPATEAQRWPLEQQMRQLQSELADAQDELEAASAEAVRLEGALREIMGSDVDIVINSDALESAAGFAASIVADLRAANGGVGPGAAAGTYGGARRKGGPTTGGRTYLVGEEGPELWSAAGNGFVTPASALRGASVSVTIAPVFNVTGSDARAIAESVRRELESAVNEAFGGVLADTGIRIS